MVLSADVVAAAVDDVADAVSEVVADVEAVVFWVVVFFVEVDSDEDAVVLSFADVAEVVVVVVVSVVVVVVVVAVVVTVVVVVAIAAFWLNSTSNVVTSTAPESVRPFDIWNSRTASCVSAS